MKKIILSLTIMTLLLSCGGAEEKNIAEEKVDQSKNTDIKDTDNVDQGESEEALSPEGTAVEGDDRYDNLSAETTTSDCFIVSQFTDMDIHYVTVDFVNYKVIEGDSEPEYELVNEIKTLRTFVVKTEYFDCSRGDEKVSVDKLIEQSKKDKETLFFIETDGGLVEELFVRNCAG
jgi:hypothetical protein